MRRFETFLLGAALLSILSGICTAGTITFLDLTETPDVSLSDPSRMLVLSCGVLTRLEQCSVQILAPAGVTSLGTISFTGPIFIAQPGGILASDTVLPPTSFSRPLSFEIDFISDLEGFPFSSCASLGGCALTEDGTPQTVGTITWSDATVDVIKFQSDVSDVPEASSCVLVLFGLAILGNAYRRHRAGAAFGG